MKLCNKSISFFIFANIIGYSQSQDPKEIDVRFNKFNSDHDSPLFHQVTIPLTAKSYPIGKNSDISSFLKWKTDAGSVVDHKDDFEVNLSIKEIIDSVGGEPDHPSNDQNAAYWEKLHKLTKLREIDDNANASSELADYMQLPLRWQNFTVHDVGEAVNDEYPGVRQVEFIEDLVAKRKYGEIKFDDDIIPRRCNSQFLRGIVMLAGLNTWTVSNVGPYNFGAKWYVGRARPEEVAFQIAKGTIDKKFVPKELFDAIVQMKLEQATNFSQYPEGSPRHPSWPAMHSAASNISFWLQVVMRLTPRQVCEAKKIDFAVAYARSVAGVHFEDDNIAGLNMGQKIVARILPEYLETKYNSTKLVVEDKISKKEFDWREYDPKQDCGTLEPTPEPTSDPNRDTPTQMPSVSPTTHPKKKSPTNPPTIDPKASGDPHFKTWAGENYDFHGLCDLILVENHGFKNNLGLDIHIRTKKMLSWLYISNAVLRIGDDIFELMGGQDGSHYWINGFVGEKMEADNTVLPFGLSGYPITFRLGLKKQHEYYIDLGDGQTITMKTWNGLVRVDVIGGTVEDFGNSRGLMGKYGSGKHLARDNVSELKDINDFGKEWQVRKNEAKLFHNLEGTQHPQLCELPSAIEMRRRLRESLISQEEAKIACSRVSYSDREQCVFDVMATNNVGIAGAY